MVDTAILSVWVVCCGLDLVRGLGGFLGVLCLIKTEFCFGMIAEGYV